MLAYYTDKARTMTTDQLKYAVKDVMETMELWKGEDHTKHDYLKKLYAEFDAYTVELYNRQRKDS